MLVIFDCDGVLIDSEVVAARLEAEAVTELGLPMTTEEICRRFAGVTTREVWATLEKELGKPLPPGFFEAFLVRVREVFADDLEAIPGARKALETIRARSIPYCVASSTQMHSLVTNLGTAGLADLFDGNVFSASLVKRPKPAPDVFLLAASQMGADPADIVVIEDSIAGVTAARRAGMTVVGFVGGSHVTPGHDERLTAAGASTIFSRMDELTAVLAARGFAIAA